MLSKSEVFNILQNTQATLREMLTSISNLIDRVESLERQVQEMKEGKDE